jgi:hypothetical protein
MRPIVYRDMRVGAGVPFVDVNAVQDAVQFVTPLTHKALLDCVSKRKESGRASERASQTDREREREREEGDEARESERAGERARASPRKRGE